MPGQHRIPWKQNLVCSPHDSILKITYWEISKLELILSSLINITYPYWVGKQLLSLSQKINSKICITLLSLRFALSININENSLPKS